MAYSKELIIETALHRFKEAKLNTTELERIYSDYYDKVGKDKFRTQASVTPEEIKKYKAFCSKQ